VHEFFREMDKLFDVSLDTGERVFRYPLTDLYLKDDQVHIEIACAGFSESDLDIELEGDTLVITGTYPTPEDDGNELKYIQKHISKSDFVRKVKLGKDHIPESENDIEASYKNGVLKIVVKKSEKPKRLIQIKV